jgi:hypothetical protein
MRDVDLYQQGSPSVRLLPGRDASSTGSRIAARRDLAMSSRASSGRPNWERDMNAMRFTKMFSRALLLAMLAAPVFAAPPVHKGGSNPGVIPPSARYGGMTYGEWQVVLHQWFFSLPAADNPLYEGNEEKIANNQPKHLWFLGNAVPVTTRYFTVPAGKALYASIFVVEWDNQLCVDPDTNYTVDQLRASAKSLVDSFKNVAVELDGVPINNVEAYRATSPVFFANTVEQYCEEPPGTYGPMVSDGYALILAPLSVGGHTVHMSGVLALDPSDPANDVPIDITWYITVVPHSR